MAVTYLAPGVYVEEINGTFSSQSNWNLDFTSEIRLGSRWAYRAPVPAFIGITAEASIKATDPMTGELVPVESCLQKPTLVTNWTEYTRIFGGFISEAYLPYAVYGFFVNGGTQCYITSISALWEHSHPLDSATVEIPGYKGVSFTLTAKTPGSWGNGLQVTVYNYLNEKGLPTGEFSLTVGDERIDNLSMQKNLDNFIGNANFGSVKVSEIGSATNLPQTGTYFLSGGGVPPLSQEDFIGNVGERTGLAGYEAIDDVNLIACPDLMQGYDGSDEAREKIKSVQTAMIWHCENMRFCFAILDVPPMMNAWQTKEWYDYLNFDTSYAALYGPWVSVPDLSDSLHTRLYVPPSGHVIGVYARNDALHGIHKSPANEIIQGVLDLEYNLTWGEHDMLNPIGVNALRAFPGRGIRIWGARTLSSDGSFRYLRTRRLLIHIEKALADGTAWVIFDDSKSPESYWDRLRQEIANYLYLCWLAGMVQGERPEDAFIIQLDDEINTKMEQDLGRTIVGITLSLPPNGGAYSFRLVYFKG